MVTAKVGTGTVSEFAGGEQALRFDHRPFAVDPPLFFTSGEVGALALAVQLLLAHTTGETSGDAERALTKIAAILPTEMRARVDELSAIVRFFAIERPFDLDDPRLVQLQQAIQGRRVVRLHYHSYRSDGQEMTMLHLGQALRVPA